MTTFMRRVAGNLILAFVWIAATGLVSSILASLLSPDDPIGVQGRLAYGIGFALIATPLIGIALAVVDVGLGLTARPRIVAILVCLAPAIPLALAGAFGAALWFATTGLLLGLTMRLPRGSPDARRVTFTDAD